MDVDGNITTLTDTLVKYPQYVPNGADRGSSGTMYDMREYKKQRQAEVTLTIIE